MEFNCTNCSHFPLLKFLLHLYPFWYGKSVILKRFFPNRACEMTPWTKTVLFTPFLLLSMCELSLMEKCNQTPASKELKRGKNRIWFHIYSIQIKWLSSLNTPSILKGLSWSVLLYIVHQYMWTKTDLTLSQRCEISQNERQYFSFGKAGILGVKGLFVCHQPVR